MERKAVKKKIIERWSKGKQSVEEMRKVGKKR